MGQNSVHKVTFCYKKKKKISSLESNSQIRPHTYTKSYQNKECCPLPNLTLYSLPNKILKSRLCLSFISDQKGFVTISSRTLLRSLSECRLEVSCTCTKAYGDRTFVFAAADMWNKLPKDIRQATSVSMFKSKLKTHLFRMYFLWLCVILWWINSCLATNFSCIVFHYACMFFCNNGNKYMRSADDLFALLPISCTFMRFSHPIAFWLCAGVSYLARFPHSTACLIGCASLIF